MTWQNTACMYGGRAMCPDVGTLVTPLRSAKNISALDVFYGATRRTLTEITPEFLQNYGEEISGLLFVGLISATENYFRDVLGYILSVCPKARAHAADEKVQLGSLLWANNQLQNRSAFEFLAFSSADSIRKALANFACYQVRTGSALEGMLSEYDKLCELRHAIVHSGQIVAGKNAIKLSLAPSAQPLRVSLSYAGLQATGAVCTALVQAANRELFEALISRWAKDWRQMSSWNAASEVKTFGQIRAGFLSKRDLKNKTVPKLTNAQLLRQVRLAFNL